MRKRVGIGKNLVNGSAPHTDTHGLISDRAKLVCLVTAHQRAISAMAFRGTGSHMSYSSSMQ